MITRYTMIANTWHGIDPCKEIDKNGKFFLSELLSNNSKSHRKSKKIISKVIDLREEKIFECIV